MLCLSFGIIHGDGDGHGERYRDGEIRGRWKMIDMN